MTTTIEKLAADHQNALGAPYPTWDEFDVHTKRHRVEAMISALSAMDDWFYFPVPGTGPCYQDLTDVKASLFDEQRYADQRRADAKGVSTP